MRRCTVISHSRLHLGFLDLHGGLGRIFGSIGVSLEEPRMTLIAEESKALEVEGDERKRMYDFAEVFYTSAEIPEGVRSHLELKSFLPPHVGLGSGTQLALTVGKALSLLHEKPYQTGEIASMMGRGRRSGVGIALFDHGGLVIDGGKKADGDDGLPPLIYKRKVPSNWFFVVVIPGYSSRMSGEREVEAFKGLPEPSPEISGAICRETLMRLLPALEERDLRSFGKAVTSIQKMVGDCFAPAQWGRFASPLSEEIVTAMKDLGATGVGQSSWGPTVYGIIDGKRAALALAGELRRLFEGEYDIKIGVTAAASRGAVWKVEEY